MTMWLLLLLLYAVSQKTVVVPNVIGLTVPTAEAKLADAGLRLAAVTEVHTDKPPRGIVMGQGPYPGKRVVINGGALGFEEAGAIAAQNGGPARRVSLVVCVPCSRDPMMILLKANHRCPWIESKKKALSRNERVDGSSFTHS